MDDDNTLLIAQKQEGNTVAIRINCKDRDDIELLCMSLIDTCMNDSVFADILGVALSGYREMKAESEAAERRRIADKTKNIKYKS